MGTNIDGICFLGAAKFEGPSGKNLNPRLNITNCI